MKRAKLKECSGDERYSELMIYGKMPDDFKIARGRKKCQDIWEIREFDGKSKYRFSFISPEVYYPLNETVIRFNRSRYHSRA